jgi:hypothetical protein
MSIAAGGAVTFTQTPVFPDGSLALADLDIDGATDIGAAIVDADLFIIDDGAGGTNRKTAASRLKTYIGSPGMTLLTSGDITSTTSSITIDSTHVTSAHDHYKLIVRGKAAGDGIEFIGRYRNAADNGNITSGYAWRVHDDGGGNSTNANDNAIRFTNQAYIGSNTNEGFNMEIDFYSPLSTLVPTSMHWKISSANTSDAFTAQRGMSRRNDGTEAHTGFILFWANGGDFANGTNYEFYGMSK